MELNKKETNWTDCLRIGLLITPFIWLVISIIFNIWNWNGFFQVLFMNIIWFAWTLDIKRLETN